MLPLSFHVTLSYLLLDSKCGNRWCNGLEGSEMMLMAVLAILVLGARKTTAIDIGLVSCPLKLLFVPTSGTRSGWRDEHALDYNPIDVNHVWLADPKFP